MVADTSDWDSEDVSSLSDAQQKFLSVLPILPCLLSCWGSGNIIYMVLTANKKTPYRRILLGLSGCDFLSSLIYPLQSFLLPAETSQRPYAIGNDASCTFLGFFQQFFFSSLWYNGMLSFYFLLTVRFGVKDPRIARRYEPWMHLLAIGWPLVTACIGAGIGLFNEMSVGMVCWAVDYPKDCETVGCDEHYNDLPGMECVPCLADELAWIMAGIPSMLNFIAILVNNLVVYWHVRRTIYRARRNVKSEAVRLSMQPNNNLLNNNNNNNNSNTSNTTPTEDPQLRRIRAVATQAAFYVGGFLICYVPAMTLRIMEAGETRAKDEANLFVLLVLQNLFLPLQGFFNMFIYVRPSYMRCRHEYPNESKYWAFRRAMYGDKIKRTKRRGTGDEGPLTTTAPNTTMNWTSTQFGTRKFRSGSRLNRLLPKRGQRNNNSKNSNISSFCGGASSIGGASGNSLQETKEEVEDVWTKPLHAAQTASASAIPTLKFDTESQEMMDPRRRDESGKVDEEASEHDTAQPEQKQEEEEEVPTPQDLEPKQEEEQQGENDLSDNDIVCQIGVIASRTMVLADSNLDEEGGGHMETSFGSRNEQEQSEQQQQQQQQQEDAEKSPVAEEEKEDISDTGEQQHR